MACRDVVSTFVVTLFIVVVVVVVREEIADEQRPECVQGTAPG